MCVYILVAIITFVLGTLGAQSLEGGILFALMAMGVTFMIRKQNNEDNVTKPENSTPTDTSPTISQKANQMLLGELAQRVFALEDQMREVQQRLDILAKTGVLAP